MVGNRRGGASKRVGELLRTVAAFSFAAIAGSAFAAEPNESQILYFEPLRPSASPATQQPATQQKGSISRELQFDAYGRRFSVSLQTNEKLSPLLQSKTGVITPIQLFKGEVNGIAGSWARIAIDEGQLRGMLWDGAELYIIEPVSKLSESLPTSAEVSANTTAIFRLADVLMKSGAASCGTDSTAVELKKGSDSFGSLMNELKGAPAMMQAAGATRRLEISALGDMLFVNRHVTEARARAEILLRLNNVDGIFSSQLGVEIQVPSIDLGDALSDTPSPQSLLQELADLRKRSPHLYSRGLTHLFTGRDLGGVSDKTVGLGYMDSLCNQRYGVALTEARAYSAWIESLIAAHELGHNFGAPHDGQANEACPDMPSDKYVMAANISGSDKFSECSLYVMQRRVTTSSCITSLPPSNISVQPDFGVLSHAVGRSFEWNVIVSNVGGLATSNGRAEIVLPPTLTIHEAFVIGGSCVSGAGVITCQLGQIPGGSSTAINLVLRSNVVGTNNVSIRVSASNDTDASNNDGSATIAIGEEADLSVELRAPAAATNGTAFDVSLTASNPSSIAARNVTVTLDLPAGIAAASAAFNGTNCTIQSATITCSLGSLASGASVNGTASLVASSDGSAFLQARIAGDYFDPSAGNDVATAAINVTSPATARQSTSSGGGGGSAGWPLLWALLALFGLKNLQRR